MANSYACQVFGEWFYDKCSIDGKLYETPYDPEVEISIVNKIRKMFCLDSVESRRRRTPYVHVLPLPEFENCID